MSLNKSQQRRERLEAMLDEATLPQDKLHAKKKLANTLDAPEEVLESRRRGTNRHHVAMSDAARRDEADSFIERIFMLILLALCIYGAIRLIMHLLTPA